MAVLRRDVTRENAKAGRYELLDDQWDELVNDWPFTDRVAKYVRHVKGDVLDLDDDTAYRLMRSGSVLPEGQRQEAEYRRARLALENARNSLPPELREKFDEDDFQKLQEQREAEGRQANIVAQAVNPGHPQYANASLGEVGVVDSQTSQQADTEETEAQAEAEKTAAEGGDQSASEETSRRGRRLP